MGEPGRGSELLTMKTIKLKIELTYDDNFFHGDDEEEKEWFFESVLDEELILHSNEIGDTVGTVKVIKTKCI